MNTETDTINEHFTLCEAAPDLLEALELMLKYCGSDDSIAAPELTARNAARASIAKAKGAK